MRLLAEVVGERVIFQERLRGMRGTLEELELGVEKVRRTAQRLGAEHEAATLVSGAPSPGVPDASGTGGFIDGFDELEMDRYSEFHLLSRQLAEAATDLGSLSDELGADSGSLTRYDQRLGRLTRDLQDGLTQARLVPLALVAERLERTVRVTGRDLDKPVELILRGTDTQVDKATLDRLVDPLVHLLRNAVDHGVETADARTPRRQARDRANRGHRSPGGHRDPHPGGRRRGWGRCGRGGP